MTTWRKAITEALELSHETWEDVVSNTLSEEELDKPFDDGWGGPCGLPFTLWTTRRTYFPTVYDGSEWVSSVARNPDGIATDHIGGG